MAMSSGKSSSMAAVLLVVALVAGTCASGAQAQFVITLQCVSPFIVDIVNGINFHSALPNGGRVLVNVPTSYFFIPPFTISFKGSRTPPIEIPQKALDELTPKGVELRKIEISCKLENNIHCITLLATYQPQRSLSSPLGPFCSGPRQ